MSTNSNDNESNSLDRAGALPNRLSELEGLRHLLLFLEGNLLRMFESGPPHELLENTEVEWMDEEHLFVNLRLVGRQGPDVDISFHLDTCSIRVQS